MKYFEMFLGGGIIMWLILVCFVIGIVVIVQKFLEIKKHKIGVGAFSIKIRGFLKKKDIAGAINFCTEDKTPLANIIRRGLKKYKFGRKRVVEAIESSSRNEIKKFEKGLPVLATIAAGAPMLGFLGTVIGLILTFSKIQNSPVNVTQTLLSGGIWQALLSAAFGLIVGIPVMSFYNYFVSVVGRNIHEMEMMAVDILDVLDSNNSEFSDDENENDEE
jgi:biopolymer transport protein ExbB